MLIFNIILLAIFTACCICISAILKGITILRYRWHVIFPFRYAPRSPRILLGGLNTRARVLWIFRRDCVLSRLASHEFCNKSHVGGAHLFSLPSAAPNIFSPGSPFSTLPSLLPPSRSNPLVYSRGIFLPHSSSALLTSAAIARSWNSMALDIGLSSFFFFFFVPTSFLSTSASCLPSALFFPVRNGAQK